MHMLKKCIHQEFHFFFNPRKEPADPREDSTPHVSGHAPQSPPQEAVMAPRASARWGAGRGLGSFTCWRITVKFLKHTAFSTRQIEKEASQKSFFMPILTNKSSLLGGTSCEGPGRLPK